jgi:hypothetical protein
MTISPDLLRDFIDGKLSGDEASDVAAKIAADPDLAAYVEDQKAVRASRVSPAAVWLERIGETAAAKSASWIPVSTMAVGIALGVLLAAVLGIGTQMRSQGGVLIAQGSLAQILSTALSADTQTSPAAARIGGSFWSKNGSFCRSFVTRGNAASALAGVACREMGAWRILAVEAIPSDASPQTPLARGDFPASVRSVIDNLIVGMPLDDAAERQLRNQGWRAK